MILQGRRCYSVSQTTTLSRLEHKRDHNDGKNYFSNTLLKDNNNSSRFIGIPIRLAVLD